VTAINSTAAPDAVACASTVPEAATRSAIHVPSRNAACWLWPFFQPPTGGHISFLGCSGCIV
jgi:hypothetical protein